MRARRSMVLVALAAAAALAPSMAGATEPRTATETLRVCSDRSNMPFSNDRGDGFENRIAEIVAAELGLSVTYGWAPQYRGFLRKTLLSGACDVVIGLSGDHPRVATTRPYYRSSYVFVTVRARPVPAGFDDPALRAARIGLHVIGTEGANAPPAASLARRSLGANVVGFPVWGAPGAQGRLVDAVARGEIDVAAAWGPAVGLYARAYGDELALTPLLSDPALPDTPFAYAVSMGVRKDDAALLDRLQGALDRRRDEIDAVLAVFGVPRAEPDIRTGELTTGASARTDAPTAAARRTP